MNKNKRNKNKNSDSRPNIFDGVPDDLFVTLVVSCLPAAQSKQDSHKGHRSAL